MDAINKNPATGAAICAASTKIQQVENPAEGTRFLQIEAKTSEPTAASRTKHKLTRVAFRVSRLMEFCSLKELQNQTGHAFYHWPLVVLKELFDNALDACEEAEVAPIIEVVVGSGFIAISDNADGIAAETIRAILDYHVRVSSREAYVSPTRGAQGNALKTIVAMAYVLDREAGQDGVKSDAMGVTVIESRGIQHRIEFRVDHVNNEPIILHTTTPCARTVGTKVTIEWPSSNGLLKNAEPQHAVLRVLQSALDLARALVRRAVRRHQGHESKLAEMGTARSDQPALVQRRSAPTLPRRPRRPRPRSRPRPHRARVRGRVPRPDRDRRAAQDPRRGRLLASIAEAVLRHQSGQPRRHRQALGGDEAAQQAGQPQAPWHHRR